MKKIRLTITRLSVAAFLLCFSMILQAQVSPGDLDPSFGNGGKVVTSIDGNSAAGASDIAIQSDGKIIAVGFAYDGINVGFGLARYNTDGSPDTTFGLGGRVITHVGGDGYSVASTVAIQSDGKIVAAGSNRTYDGDNDNFLVARYNTDGSLDTSFGAGGKVVTLFYAGYASGMAIQSDGKIVVAGSGIIGARNFLIVRYNTDGSLDNSFGTGGKVTTPIGGGGDIKAIAIHADGRIVAAGYASVV